MLLSQIAGPNGGIIVLVREDGEAAREVQGATGVHALALEAANSGRRIADVVAIYGLGAEHDPAALARDDRYLAPITHPDPTHLHLTGTGLTHLGSAATRDGMHAEVKQVEVGATDTMKMFRMGIEGGKPDIGKAGVQPEWFYKGNGHSLAAPGQPLTSPAFALDHGEEPEMAGIYIIDEKGQAFRLGFAVSNEFSDHVTERQNYLYLAHSKLRPASIGPEIRVGAPPSDIRGTSRILRDGAVLWEKPFLSGEDNMSHSFANLEYHHFKYRLFRRPGDVHVHMFGTATLSFGDNVRVEPGDVFEIEATGFGQALRNAVALDAPESFSELAVRDL